MCSGGPHAGALSRRVISFPRFPRPVFPKGTSDVLQNHRDNMCCPRGVARASFILGTRLQSSRKCVLGGLKLRPSFAFSCNHHTCDRFLGSCREPSLLAQWPSFWRVRHHGQKLTSCRTCTRSKANVSSSVFAHTANDPPSLQGMAFCFLWASYIMIRLPSIMMPPRKSPSHGSLKISANPPNAQALHVGWYLLTYALH